MKKIALIGGLGRIGHVIYTQLKHKYEFVIIDKQASDTIAVIHADVSDYQSLIEAIPKDTNILFDLTAYKLPEKSMGNKDFEVMKQTYIQGIYNVFEAAKTLNIKSVVYASTCHVTGLYEKDGLSLPGRKIKTSDYPKPDSIYSSMKLFGESIARLYALNHKIKVICLRFGAVKTHSLIYKVSKSNKSIFLFHEDLIKIIESVFESDIDFGIYYAVSENAGKPWNTRQLKRDLKLKRSDFVARKNSTLFHKGYMRIWRFLHKN
ncbi:MAG: NAD(P)-dependent oxidoreductase [Bacteroidales bacterium]|nr:NAD(P)-dependent oxidoreductase [Bacteroidales bacterium]